MAEASRRGLTRANLRSGAWQTWIHGVRTPRDVKPTTLEQCSAISLVLDDGVAFSHVTALRLLGIEVPWRLERDDRVHTVSRRRADRPQHGQLVAHHSTQSIETTEVDGLPVTTPAQTWVHLGTSLRPDDVVVLGDAMLRRVDPATTLAELARLATSTRKVKGIRQVRESLGHLRARTDSSMETRTRLVLVAAGLPCPAVNEDIYDDGRFVARPDMLYREAKIAIEYEGDGHRTTQSVWRRDLQKARELELLGWRVIRVVADDIIRNPQALVAAVAAALSGRPPTTTLWA